ncbi:queuosine precursor transporter [Brevibacterium salitolerans]|uniref:Probable queuosine precursor transporter n=2 Tax=Brevibacteriaceae TaxID=85019 RepID=A0ABN2WND5_9MICO
MSNSSDTGAGAPGTHASGQPGPHAQATAQAVSGNAAGSAENTDSAAGAGVTGTDGAPGAGAMTAFASTRGRYYALILAVFCCVFIISNISATKVIGFGPIVGDFSIVTDGGAFLFPLAYILGDVLSEVYGFRAARRAVFMGFAMQALAVLVFYLVMVSPPGPGYESQEAFEAVLGFYPRIVAASLAGYVVGQLLNSYVLVWVKRRMGEKHLWVRLMTSTGVGEFADTLIFCIVAFAGVIPGADFINYIIVGFVYKVAVEVILMPVTYTVIRVLKKREVSYAPGGED